MSNKALNWVAQLDLKAKHAYPLMVIADGVNDFGIGTFSEEYLAWRLGNSARTVRTAIKELTDMGLVRRSMTYRSDGSRGQSQIVLVMSEENLTRYPKTSWEATRARLWQERMAKREAYRASLEPGQKEPEMREWGDDLPPVGWENEQPEPVDAPVDNCLTGSFKVLPENFSGSHSERSLNTDAAVDKSDFPHDSGVLADAPAEGGSQGPLRYYRKISAVLPENFSSRVRGSLINHDRSDAGASRNPQPSVGTSGSMDGFDHGVDLAKLAVLVKSTTGVSCPPGRLAQAVELVMARTSGPLKNPTAYVARAIGNDPTLVTARSVVITRHQEADTVCCSKPGHENYPASNCAGCRADALSSPKPAQAPQPVTSVGSGSVRRFGAEDVRAALRGARALAEGGQS